MRSTVIALVLVVSAYAGPDQQTLRAIKDAIAKLKSRDYRTKLKAARDLGRYGRAAKIAVPHLAKALGDEGIRYAASESLRAIGAVGAPALVKALKSRSPDARAAICDILKDKKIVGHLQPHAKKLTVVLGDSDPGVRRAGIALFSAIGARGVDALLSALKVSKPVARSSAAEALGEAGLLSIPRLRAAYEKTKSARVRGGICVAFGHMGEKAKTAAPTLVQALDDANEDVRAEAARAIGRTGASYKAAEDRLFGGLAAESQGMREGCIDGLAAYGAASAPALAKRLGSSKPIVRAGATEALFRMGGPGVPSLHEVLQDGAPAQRLAAIGLFLRFRALAPRRETLRGLRDCLKNGSVAVRRDAASALGRLGRSQVVETKPDATAAALVVGAGDKDASVRAAALASLGRLGSRAAIETVAKARKDADPRVRMAAYSGQWGIDGKPVPALAGLRAGLKDPTARDTAVDALGRMGAAAEAAIPELAELLQHPEPETRRAAAQALGRIVRPGRANVKGLRGSWTKKAPPAVRKAIEAGLRWLAENQESEDGFWDSDKHGGQPLFDVGVTGLALWAFLGAGHDGTAGPHAAVVRRGLDYVLRMQDVDGVLGTRATHSFLTCHAVGGIALVEASLLTGDPRYVHAIETAVDYVEAARNPGGAWRYLPRGGENDTHVTTWMVTFLRLADLGGVRVDPMTYQGAAGWIDRMTDPNFGQTGYNYPGGAPARPENKQDTFPPEKSQSMTAAAAWCRQLMGGALLSSSEYPRSMMLCAEHLPEAGMESRDLYYFHFGALAMFQQGKAWKSWGAALGKTLLPLQTSEGSWPHTGVWGDDGGRVYSTAIAVLSLLTPYRYPRGFATSPNVTPPERTAINALKRAAKDDDPGVRAAAEQALRQVALRRTAK